MVSTKLLTAEELERLSDRGGRYELVQGELVEMTPIDLVHVRVSGNIQAALHRFSSENQLGIVGSEGGFVLFRDPDTVRAPDVAFVRADRWPRGEAERHFGYFPPDLAVEVRPPSESMRSLRAKAQMYIEAGVRLVWLVDPDSRTILVIAPDTEITTLHESDTVEGGDVLPGFRMSLVDVFR
jgi:Uma2 family endonuclease